MRTLVYLPTAQEDIQAILREITIETGDLRVGLGFTAKLERRCERLATLPGTLGTPRPELRADIRSISEQNYVIFFRYAGEEIEIVNVLHGHRDIVAHFSQSH